jgi:hypothetical protein
MIFVSNCTVDDENQSARIECKMGKKKEISVLGVYDTNKNMNDAEP